MMLVAPGAPFVAKRCMDVVVAVTALIALAPVLLSIGALIRVDSAGPALFRQTRIGRDGRRFEIWKYRTMHVGARDQPHRQLIAQLQHRGVDAYPGQPLQKLVDDPRVTRVGWWLRRLSIDELPQLINVLRGEMSLVGPRPLLIYEHQGLAGWKLDRTRMQPGITGLWQVSGRSRLSYEQMFELDVEYVRRWSPWLDVVILAMTIPALFCTQATA